MYPLPTGEVLLHDFRRYLMLISKKPESCWLAMAAACREAPGGPGQVPAVCRGGCQRQQGMSRARLRRTGPGEGRSPPQTALRFLLVSCHRTQRRSCDAPSGVVPALSSSPALLSKSPMQTSWGRNKRRLWEPGISCPPASHVRGVGFGKQLLGRSLVRGLQTTGPVSALPSRPGGSWRGRARCTRLLRPLLRETPSSSSNLEPACAQPCSYSRECHRSRG